MGRREDGTTPVTEHREVLVGASRARVTEEDLRAVVSECRSWRGVLRAVGLTGTSVGRTLRAKADAWGIDYNHFDHQHGGPVELQRVVTEGRRWTEVLERLGYSVDSGSARANVRRQCRAKGIDCSHLDRPAPAKTLFSGPAELARLREAGAYLVAAACGLRGCSVSWPLEPVAYDLVVDAGPSGLLRVQVKTATSKMDGSWVAWITRGDRVPYSREEVDWFGVVDGELAVYMIPIDVVEGQASVHLRHYQDYRLR